MGRLDGKVALITDSDSGIGQASIVAFLLEVAPGALNVNSLAPGMVLTPFNQQAGSCATPVRAPELMSEHRQSDRSMR